MNQKEIDSLSQEEIGELFPIILSKPNSKQLFEGEKYRLNEILGKYITRIEYIGSTAIPNILAKSTIDVLVEIREFKY